MIAGGMESPVPARFGWFVKASPLGLGRSRSVAGRHGSDTTGPASQVGGKSRHGARARALVVVEFPAPKVGLMGGGQRYLPPNRKPRAVEARAWWEVARHELGHRGQGPEELHSGRPAKVERRSTLGS
ncbi:hypothetical protein NL676_009589 [Syzygium grande]|nr:hypothetical protein NL676_009589 [Syzygium grande]